MKKALSFLIFVLLISTVSALTITKQSLNDVIIPEFNQPANFKLTISGSEAGTYKIYTLTDVRLMPVSNFQLSGLNVIDIYVYPTDTLSERGFYSFTYNLKKLDQEPIENRLTVKIVNLRDAIEINSNSNDPVSGKINFYIENKENAKIKNIKAKFSSIFFDFEETFDLNPNERKEFSVVVDKEKVRTIIAGSYIMKAEIETDKGTKTLEGKIFLGEKKGVETQEDSSGILIHTNTITKINIGNAYEQVQVKSKKDVFTRLFTSFNIEPDFVERDGLSVEYIWNKELKPAEIYNIKIKTNYFLPLLIIIFAGIIILLFKRFTETKVEIRKSVSPVKTKSNVFVLKVRINVKAKKDVDNVSLIDKVPAVVKIYEKFGLVKPDKIDAKNRRIHWFIGNMSAGEERVFNYVIYSKVGVLGKFSLPEALAVFEKNDEIHEVESNQVFFLTEQTSRDDD